MTDSNITAAPAKTTQTHALFNAKQLRELDEADTVVLAARKPANATALALREVTSAMVDYLADQSKATRDLLTASKAKKGNAKGHTEAADAAREAVIVLLQEVQSAARQKFGAKDPSINATYYGSTKLRESRAVLTQAVEGILQTLQTVTLPGISPTTITAIQTQFAAYESALDSQGDGHGAGATDYQSAVDLLKIVNEKRQQIQFAANAAFPASNKLNRETRKDFKLDPDKNFVG